MIKFVICDFVVVVEFSVNFFVSGEFGRGDFSGGGGYEDLKEVYCEDRYDFVVV